MSGLEARIESFRSQIIEGGVLDPQGTHHEFKSGMHGQKLDFDVLPRDSNLYRTWVDVTVEYIGHYFDELPEAVLGVANGTNRLAVDVASKFDGKMLGLVSEKDRHDPGKIRLTELAMRAIKGTDPNLVLVLEDVGTTGSSSVQPAEAAWKILDSPLYRVEVLTTWKRRQKLEKLEDADIPNHAVIDEPLPTYTPEDCQSLPEGFCSQGWEFIPREK